VLHSSQTQELALQRSQTAEEFRAIKRAEILAFQDHTWNMVKLKVRF